VNRQEHDGISSASLEVQDCEQLHCYDAS